MTSERWIPDIYIFTLFPHKYLHSLSPGGVLPIWWVIHMCRGFDPLFDPLGTKLDLFGVFFLIHQHKHDLLGTNPRKIRSCWPQNTIFPSIFSGPIFSGPRHTPSNFRTEYPPPPQGAYCPACRTTLVATRFRVAVICPMIQVPHCIRVFFYFVWFVFINHIFQFYYELCTYCNILDIYLS